jgi:hypothetical protein
MAGTTGTSALAAQVKPSYGTKKKPKKVKRK